MKQFKLKINTEELNGTITLELPNYQEKAEISKKLRIGEEGVSEMDQLIIILDEIRPKIKNVDLVVRLGGQPISDFEELEYITEGQEVIKQVTTAFLGGVSLGKILK